MKACNGIVVQPIKGAQLVSQVEAQKPVAPPNRYAPPSKRKEEVKTLTKDEINSDLLFPSLAPMKPMTTGASWSQLRNRLSQPANPFSVLSEDNATVNPVVKPEMNFMHVIDERIKREKAEKEEGVKRDAITEPSQMTMEQRDAHGWTTLRLPPNFVEFNERLSAYKPLKEQDYYDSGHAFDSPWTRGMPVECVHLGGAPIERKEKKVDHFADFFLNKDPVITYSPISEASVAAAKAKFAGFFRKGEKSMV
jgi:hypothetical protein